MTLYLVSPHQLALFLFWGLPPTIRQSRYGPATCIVSILLQRRLHDSCCTGHLARGGHPRGDRIPSAMSQPPIELHAHPRYPTDRSSRASERANKGFNDFKSFVKRNYEASKADSPKRQPYSDRLSGKKTLNVIEVLPLHSQLKVSVFIV